MTRFVAEWRDMTIDVPYERVIWEVEPTEFGAKISFLNNNEKHLFMLFESFEKADDALCNARTASLSDRNRICTVKIDEDYITK